MITVIWMLAAAAACWAVVSLWGTVHRCTWPGCRRWTAETDWRPLCPTHRRLHDSDQARHWADTTNPGGTR